MHVSLSTAPLRAADGTPSGIMAVVTDVSARRRAEEALRENGERLALLSQVLSDLARAPSVEAIVAIVKSSARALVGADRSALVLRDGDTCLCVDEDGIGPHWKGQRFPLDQCVSGWTMLHGVPAAITEIGADPRVSLETCRTTVKSLVMIPFGRTGTEGAIGVYWDTRHSASGEELGLIQALADATSVALDNVATLERLRRSEEQYRRLVENLDDIVYTVDAEGRITYVSGAVARYGYVPAELIGRRFLDFTHPDDRSRVEQAFAARLAADLEPIEYRVLDREGRVRVVRSSSRRILEDGRTTGMLGVLFDLTAQRQTEEALRGAQKMEALGRLAGGVAHDFNNILTVISSYAGLSLRGLATDNPLRPDLEEIRRASDRATGLTRQLLAFSRRQVLQPSVIDLNLLVGGIEKMLGRLIGEDVDLRFFAASGLGRICADPGQIEQVLMNLVVNARDAMPGGGTLTITTGDASSTRTSPSATPAGGWGPTWC